MRNMKLTIKKIKEVYNALSKANASKLNDTEFKKVLAILKKIYPLQAEAKEKRVRVELSLNREMPRPESKILVEMLFSRR